MRRDIQKFFILFAMWCSFRIVHNFCIPQSVRNSKISLTGASSFHGTISIYRTQCMIFFSYKMMLSEIKSENKIEMHLLCEPERERNNIDRSIKSVIDWQWKLKFFNSVNFVNALGFVLFGFIFGIHHTYSLRVILMEWGSGSLLLCQMRPRWMETWCEQMSIYIGFWCMRILMSD